MPLLLINYSTFKLLNDGLTSTDINECENPNNCNHLGQLCINEPGKFTCVCIKGYHLVQSAGVCVINQSSLQVKLLVGKYIYCIAPSHIWIIMLQEFALDCELSFSFFGTDFVFVF